MPAIRKEDKVKTEIFNANVVAATAASEKNDCGVKALAAVLNWDYKKAHKALADAGRNLDGDGTQDNEIRAALKANGFKVTFWSSQKIEARVRSYPGVHGRVLKNITTHHFARFPGCFEDTAEKNLLVFTKGHVAGVVNNLNHDWTKGRAFRVVAIWEVTKQ